MSIVDTVLAYQVREAVLPELMGSAKAPEIVPLET
jgi:hypothetical protein